MFGMSMPHFGRTRATYRSSCTAWHGGGVPTSMWQWHSADWRLVLDRFSLCQVATGAAKKCAVNMAPLLTNPLDAHSFASLSDHPSGSLSPPPDQSPQALSTS